MAEPSRRIIAMGKSYTPAELKVIARDTANRSVVQPGGGGSRAQIGLACASKANRSSLARIIHERSAEGRTCMESPFVSHPCDEK